MTTIDLSAFDVHFSQKLVELSSNNDSTILLNSIKLLSHLNSQGNICLVLDDFAGKSFNYRYQDRETVVKFPEIEEWVSVLINSNIVTDQQEHKPLLLDKNHQRLYLYRYWQYEQTLINTFKSFAKVGAGNIDQNKLNQGLKDLFPTSNEDKKPLEAAKTALENRFCVITGGPGTGKTTTVVKIMVLLLEQDTNTRIVLAAPTGKAAARLKESIVSGKENLKDTVSSSVTNLIQEETSTIHRLLGSIKNSVYFKYNEDNPLNIDCLILDEASMIDMALMSKLVSALPEGCRLILLGDKNQLSSVEAGSVFGDICSSANNLLKNNIVQLTKSYRFDQHSGIGKLSSLILNERGVESYEYLTSDSDSRVSWKDLPEKADLKSFIQNNILATINTYFSFQNIEDAFAGFRSFLILTAMRHGPFGSENINRIIEELLLETGIIPRNKQWYVGKPVLITRNDYTLNLFNGDLGIFHVDPEDGNLKVYFETEEGHRKLSPSRLPDHETVFAMTIHKSQGSEFDKVLIVLPDKENDVLTRELIYTGITRARTKLQLWGNKEVFIKSVKKTIKRNSGLIDGLGSD
ncbi:exodeoxyribonuclease V subunit alpha [bacterium]|nr:exodeoxyribonuclease V subunit alpha [bacterium]